MRFAPVTIFSLVALATASAAPSGAGGSDGLEGRYALAEPQHAEATIDAAIDSVVSELFFLARPFARSKLKAATDPCPKLEIDLEPETVSVWCPRDEDRFVSPSDGQPVETTFEEKKLTLEQQVRGDEIRQRMEGQDGVRINRYRLEGDRETLRMEIELKSPRLPRPVRYAIRYEKVDG
jgi:hypothetical protein